MWSIEALKFLVITMCACNIVTCSILIGFAGHFISTSEPYSNLFQEAVDDLPVTAICLAALVILLAIICIIGAIKENRFVLYVATAMLCAEVAAAAVLLFVYLAVFTDGRNLLARKEMLRRQCPSLGLIYAQQNFQCCGYRGPMDYEPREIHKSCCRGKPDECPEDSPLLFSQGCVPALTDELWRAGRTGAWLCCSLLLLETFTVVLVYVLCDELKKEDEDIEAELEDDLRADNISARKSEIRQALRVASREAEGGREGRRSRSRLSSSGTSAGGIARGKGVERRKSGDSSNEVMEYRYSSRYQPSDTSSYTYDNHRSLGHEVGLSTLEQPRESLHQSIRSKYNSKPGPSKNEEEPRPYMHQMELQQASSKHKARSSKHERVSEQNLFPPEPRLSRSRRGRPRLTRRRWSRGVMMEAMFSQRVSATFRAPRQESQPRQSDPPSPLTSQRSSEPLRSPEDKRPPPDNTALFTPRPSNVQRTPSDPRLSRTPEPSISPTQLDAQRQPEVQISSSSSPPPPPPPPPPPTTTTTTTTHLENLRPNETPRLSEAERDSAKLKSSISSADSETPSK